MKMSEAVEWALHCATLLASLEPNAALPAKSLAEYHGISESYLLKHLKSMAKYGILESVPGPKGGYRLTRSPDEITFLDIVEAVEGKGPAFRCTEIRRRGPVAPDPKACLLPCAIHTVMDSAERVWKDELRQKTIGQIVGHLRETLGKTSQESTAAWLETKARK